MEEQCDGTSVSISEHSQLNQRQCIVLSQEAASLSDEYLNSQLAARELKDLR